MRDGDGLKPQDSRILRILSLASNSPYFTRKLTENAPRRTAIPSTTHLKLAKTHRNYQASGYLGKVPHASIRDPREPPPYDSYLEIST